MAPTSHESIDLFVSQVLHTLLGRHGALQVFLFGPAGEPFWCARKPLAPEGACEQVGAVQTNIVQAGMACANCITDCWCRATTAIYVCR